MLSNSIASALASKIASETASERDEENILSNSQYNVIKWWDEYTKKYIQEELLNRINLAFQIGAAYTSISLKNMDSQCYPNSSNSSSNSASGSLADLISSQTSVDDKPAFGGEVRSLSDAYSLSNTTSYNNIISCNLSDISVSSLEQKLKNYNCSIADPKLIKTAQYVSSLLHHFYKHNLKSLESFTQSMGAKLRHPQRLIVSPYNSDTLIAYTDGKKIIGAAPDFKEKIKRMSKETTLDPASIEEFFITHEFMHLAQPYELFYAPEVIEPHNEGLLMIYFYQKALSKEGKDAEKYLRFADLAYNRMIARYIASKRKAPSSAIEQLLDMMYEEGKNFYNNNVLPLLKTYTSLSGSNGKIPYY